MKRVAFVIVLGSCGGSTRPVDPPSGRAPGRPAPAGFAKADLVSLGNGTITTYAIERERVVKLGEVKIAEPIVEHPDDDYETRWSRGYQFPLIGDWADRDHLFVRTGARKVVMVTPAGITDVAVPAESTLAIDHPEDASSTGYTIDGKAYMNTDLVVEDGAAWWSRCPFSFANDGGYCFKWVNARLWPTPKLEIAEDDRNPRAFAWPEAAPKGYSISDDRPRVCTPPSGPPVTLTAPKAADDETDSGERVFGAHWVSATPPRLLVTYGYSPEFSAPYVTRSELFDGCGPSPIWSGGAPAAGPDGLWAASGHVFRGGTELGVAGNVRFRPRR